MKKKIQVLVQDEEEEEKKPNPALLKASPMQKIFLGKRQIVYIQMHIIDLIATF